MQPIIKLSDFWKRVISVAFTIITTVILGLAKIFGWELPNYVVIIDLVILLAASLTGIILVAPKKPSNKTGGSG